MRRERLKLADGAEVVIRALQREDRAGLKAAMARLSDESRYLRFATAKPRLSERELDHLVDVDHHGHEALVAIDAATGEGVAVVRYVRLNGEPGAAEVAATVIDDWQGRGLGGAMLARLRGGPLRVAGKHTGGEPALDRDAAPCGLSLALARRDPARV
jgi:GNAT superfamily N-acetyltransferase